MSCMHVALLQLSMFVTNKRSGKAVTQYTAKSCVQQLQNMQSQSFSMQPIKAFSPFVLPVLR